jgi:hypothetical protein
VELLRNVDPDASSAENAPPNLRLLEGRSAAPETSGGLLRAWILLFGSLSFSGGHGLFLFTALTRLHKVPSSAELGSRAQMAVLAWFVAAGPLALAAVPLRRRFQRLGPRLAWSFATLAFLLSLGAFTLYLRAVALG